VTDDAWTLRAAASAERQLARLSGRIAAAVDEFMLGPLSDNPRQVGHPLQRELAGLWSARRGAYRVNYEIGDDERFIDILRIEHRSDIYRPR
jgi:mRNA-degrading endonuclease RelE of RelBE toxin-antitoxin system